jgi:hypothetical protein
MSTEKIKIVGYVTPEEKASIQERAKILGLSIGAYFNELSMWDNRHDLIPQLRKGGSITCNGRHQN